MRRRSFLSSAAVLFGGEMIANQQVDAQSDLHPASGDLRHHGRTASVMVEATNRFLALLTPEQKVKTVFPFDDKDRTHWFYSPGFGSDWTRDPGLGFHHMNPNQQQMAGALLASGLSQAAFMKAVTIMTFGPDSYYFTIFGTPSATGTWGYCVQGHHLSQHYTVTNGHVVNGPSFFGILPLEVDKGPRRGLRTLGQEEDLGFEVIHTLDEPLQKIAIVDPTAYGDILTANSRKAALKGQPSGLPASRMNPRQYDALRALAELYARNLPDDIAQGRLDQIDKAGRDAWFAWAGGTKAGGPHYYRMHTKSFLLEFDNLDATGNHIHSVWRDLTGDWGEGLLEAHYKQSHREKNA